MIMKSIISNRKKIYNFLLVLVILLIFVYIYWNESNLYGIIRIEKNEEKEKVMVKIIEENEEKEKAMVKIIDLAKPLENDDGIPCKVAEEINGIKSTICYFKSNDFVSENIEKTGYWEFELLS